jgi:hypothetical protein
LVIRSSSGVGTTGCFEPLATDEAAASAVLDDAVLAATPLATLAASPRARSSPLLAPPSSAAAARLRLARAA